MPFRITHKKSQFEFQVAGKNQLHVKPLRLVYAAAVAVLLLAMGCGVVYSGTHQKETLKLKRENIRKRDHRSNILSVSGLESFTDKVNIDELWRQLTPILIPRRPDTENIRQVRSHINNTLTRLKGWNVEYDTFVDKTPVGRKTFSNILASTNPNANQKLVLACHYDSKDFRQRGFEFIGATDSAVPCAMLLEIARALNSSLKDLTRKQLAGVAGAPDISLDLIFFDGEEAFRRWSATDSLYGSRHLAEKWNDLNGRNVLRDISLFVLLDLIGHSDTRFVKFYSHRSKWFDYCKWIEAKLKYRNLLSHRRNVFYYHGRYEFSVVEDDHIPFQDKGVPILHLISAPFPRQWHTQADNEAALNPTRIDVITKILTVFVAEYLHLSP